MQLDIASPRSVDDFGRWAEQELPNVDILINNAGDLLLGLTGLERSGGSTTRRFFTLPGLCLHSPDRYNCWSEDCLADKRIRHKDQAIQECYKGSSLLYHMLFAKTLHLATRAEHGLLCRQAFSQSVALHLWSKRGTPASGLQYECGLDK